METKFIKVHGAREHNLKSISIDIPKNSLVVITGPSGSGKSSLAFDTIYAEGQRRYVESLSAYARQFLGVMKKPDVDYIDGLSPAISIEQKTTSNNPRSTVGTITEIYDYLRLLYARVGIAYSPVTGLPINAQSISQMVDTIRALKPGTKIYIEAPKVRGQKGEFKGLITQLIKGGFARVKVDGQVYELESVPALDKNKRHNISVIIDRLVINDGDDIKSRIAQSLEVALNLTDGIAQVELLEQEKTLTFSSKFACPQSGFSIAEIEPRLFSFNSPFGACQNCNGLGQVVSFTEELIVPDMDKSVLEGAVKPLYSGSGMSGYYCQILSSVVRYFGEDPDQPYHYLSDKMREIIMYGSGEEPIATKMITETGNIYQSKKPFKGVINMLLEKVNDIGTSERRKRILLNYQTKKPCDECHGYRLSSQALAVKVGELHIGKLCEMSLSQLYKWLTNVEGELTKQQLTIATRVIKEIRERLKFLVNVGLEYLNLARSAGTLSGGEAQRIRLASQIGSGLTGVLYVLDEPSIGLHQRDNDRLLETLKSLRDLGNTVIVVEHDEDAIKSADFIIDIGPYAGLGGGEIIAKGSLDDIMANQKSITGQYISGKKQIAVPEKRRKIEKRMIHVKGARANNLQNIDVSIPVGKMVCVTGVSGSGKSSLVFGTLYRYLKYRFGRKVDNAPSGHEFGEGEGQLCSDVTGLEYITRVIDIDQSPIGRTPRSNPATYIDLFTIIRDWFSNLPESKARGYRPGRFSFNVKGGRCEHCQGDGVIKVEMHFLPDVYVTCDQCEGKRYNRETLEIQYKGKSIADILEMTVDQGKDFFTSIAIIHDKLNLLSKVGLGYIKIGQSSTTLSGGEAQRIKLAKELSKRSNDSTLYILDEPTTGLHFDDINKLLEVLHSLVEKGNTVLIIEHNLDVIKTADYIIDIGPEGGAKGGKLIAQGTPEEIAKNPKSYTGLYLKRYLSSD